jgi:HEAT repeat protein
MTKDEMGTGRTYDAMNARGLAGKRDYVRSLEQRRDLEAMSLLVECLCDESWYLRELAEGALMRVGETSAEALVPLLDTGLWYSRASAARVLGALGFAPAVPGMLRLCADLNSTVAAAARQALAELAHRGGSARLAWELHRAPADLRRRRIGEMAAIDRPLGERLERLLGNEELMSLEDPADLLDGGALVRASEEGVEWEILTGPPPARTAREAPPREPGA